MASLSKIMEDYKERLIDVARGGTEDLTEAVILGYTPVLTSSLRESWTPNKGEPIANNVTLSSPRTNESFPAAQDVIYSINAGDIFSLANGKDYARRIEHDQWSGKAPNGMLWVNVVGWNNFVQHRASIARAS